MEDNEQMTDVFLRLNPFYILITIHDIEDYSLKDLKNLANSLQKQLKLDSQADQINQQLTQKSNENLANKKKKKKEKKQALLQIPIDKMALDNTKESEISDMSIDKDLSGTIVSQSNQMRKQTKWRVTHAFKGFIYDGKLIIKMNVASKDSKDPIIAHFNVSSESKSSFISVKTLKELKIKSKNLQQIIELVVQNKLQKFLIKEQGPNCLGFDFLKDHKAIVTCNYRSQCFNFILQLTQ